MGCVTILYAKSLTDGDPAVVGFIYFAMLFISKGITTGFFTPLGSFVSWVLGQMPNDEFMYNLIAQFSAAVLVAVTFLPITAYMHHFQ